MIVIMSILKRLDRIFKISVKKYFKEVKFKNNYDLNCNKNQTSKN